MKLRSSYSIPASFLTSTRCGAIVTPYLVYIKLEIALAPWKSLVFCMVYYLMLGSIGFRERGSLGVPVGGGPGSGMDRTAPIGPLKLPVAGNCPLHYIIGPAYHNPLVFGSLLPFAAPFFSTVSCTARRMSYCGLITAIAYSLICA